MVENESVDDLKEVDVTTTIVEEILELLQLHFHFHHHFLLLLQLLLKLNSLKMIKRLRLMLIDTRIFQVELNR